MSGFGQDSDQDGIWLGGKFLPGWSTIGAEKNAAADNLDVMSTWKKEHGLGAASYYDWVLADKMRNEARTRTMFVDPTMPVAPWARHNYNGPAQNLAQSFGLNAQAGAIRDRAAQREAQPASPMMGGYGGYGGYGGGYAGNSYGGHNYGSHSYGTNSPGFGGGFRGYGYG